MAEYCAFTLPFCKPIKLESNQHLVGALCGCPTGHHIVNGNHDAGESQESVTVTTLCITNAFMVLALA
jgi:hypothetical protein